MDNELKFGQKEEVKFCPVCGRVLIYGKCPKIHKSKLPQRGRFSGVSKRPFGKYEVY